MALLAVALLAVALLAVALLATAHQRVRRQRQDFHHKAALTLLRANDTIYPEDVQTATRVTNHPLAKKSLQAAGWSHCLSLLAFKAAGAGKRVGAVPPACTSQLCSGWSVVV